MCDELSFTFNKLFVTYCLQISVINVGIQSLCAVQKCTAFSVYQRHIFRNLDLVQKQLHQLYARNQYPSCHKFHISNNFIRCKRCMKNCVDRQAQSIKEKNKANPFLTHRITFIARPSVGNPILGCVTFNLTWNPSRGSQQRLP